MAVRKLYKQLAGIEDVLLGNGTVLQTRNNVEYTITGIGGATLPYDASGGSSIKTTVDPLISASHSHSNKTTLDLITAAFTTTLLTKLNGIEASATADQTGAEIKVLYEAELDTNAFTDALLTKLNGIEASATADQTAAEILTLLLTVDGTGSSLDADLLDGLEAAAFALAAHVHALNDLSDVVAPTPSEGEALIYTSGSWSPGIAGDRAYVSESFPSILPSATGTDALAMGDGAIAKEINNIAIGASAVAGNTDGGVAEPDAVAIGYLAKAYENGNISIGRAATSGSAASSDLQSIAIGWNAKSLGGYALALGRSADSYGVASIGIGADSAAKENYNIAIGYLAITGQINDGSAEENAIAIGRTAIAYENSCISIGYAASAGTSGGSATPYSIAIGYLALAKGINSVAIGPNVTNATDNEVHLGTSNTNKMVLDSTGNLTLPTGLVRVKPVVTVTATSTGIVDNEHVYVTAATQTITLPASASAGDTITVSVGGFTDTVIARNGHNIMSAAADLTLSVADTTTSLRYIDVTRGWVIL